jgi:hypothetical protein
MKYLVIHMSDPTTRFLEHIYAHLPKEQVTLVDQPMPAPTLNQLILSHDRVLMLGHGLHGGLFSMGQPPYVISEANVEALRQKRDSVFIWCYASAFVRAHGLQGFASGMFISEVVEAAMNGITATQQAITASNERFGRLAGECIERPATELLAHLKEHYDGDCPVISFNRERLEILPGIPGDVCDEVQLQHQVKYDWALLNRLNGQQKGAFFNYQAEWKRKGRLPRMAWYPSSGTDLRDLLYLNPAFLQGREDAVLPPDLFIHTDYFPWQNSTFLDSKEVFNDRHTRIRVVDIEELPRLHLPLSPELVNLDQGSSATHRVVFLQLEVTSKHLGNLKAPLLYVFAENSAFADFAMRHGARFTHCIHVRFGGGCGGGGKSSGIWMLNILGRLGCECIISDEHYHLQQGDQAAMRLFPSLQPETPAAVLDEPMFTLPSFSWSGHGNVTWRRVQPTLRN